MKISKVISAPRMGFEFFRGTNLMLVDTDKIFVISWNEWAEGGYLESDEKFGYGYLEAIQQALNKNAGA